VRTDLNQAPQPALQGSQLGDLVADRDELRLRRPRDVGCRPGLGRAEQVADLGEREAKLPSPPDEREPPPVGLRVFAESRAVRFRQREQSSALVEAHGLDADSGLGCELPDGQTSHVMTLTAVPRYGVKSARPLSALPASIGILTANNS
jgi:hypothetical protein